LTFSVASNAQITILAISTDIFPEGETDIPSQSLEEIQIFNISLADKIFVHNILAPDGSGIIDSQMYDIISIEEDGDNATMIKTESGLTGNIFTYYLILNDAGNYVLIQYFEDNGSMARFNGFHSSLKTIAQE